MRIAVIGSGLTGLTCARHLADAGHAPVIYDKGRRVGGRLSTRRAEGGLQFDHGAQYITAKSDAFVAALSTLEAEGALSRWHFKGAGRKYVGLPGMSGLAKHLARGLDVRQGAEVRSISRTPEAGFAVHLKSEIQHFDRVVCTVPAPQAARLLGRDSLLTAALSSVVMEPNLTLMLTLDDSPKPFETRRTPEDDISWIAQDSAKPGRGSATCWVAQAGLAWSKEHLERDKPDIAALMLPMVCARLGADPATATYVAAHRWRYAFASTPLGKSFLSDGKDLFVGGDWTLSARAEGAWQSGIAMANAILAS